MTSPGDLADVRERVRARYADAAAAFTEYTDGLAQAGFAAITITPTHERADGLYSAIIRAARS
jgi:hypothetical protein